MLVMIVIGKFTIAIPTVCAGLGALVLWFSLPLVCVLRVASGRVVGGVVSSLSSPVQRSVNCRVGP